MVDPGVLDMADYLLQHGMVQLHPTLLVSLRYSMAENLEEPGFDIIKQYKHFEIRSYSDTIQARVLTPGDGWANSSGGFRRIAGYIFGRNERKQSIAMTALFTCGRRKEDQ